MRALNPALHKQIIDASKNNNTGETMRAEDTVMPIEERIKFGVWHGRERFAQAQAEISFKLRTEDILKQLNGFNQRGLTLTEAIALLQ